VALFVATIHLWCEFTVLAPMYEVDLIIFVVKHTLGVYAIFYITKVTRGRLFLPSRYNLVSFTTRKKSVSWYDTIVIRRKVSLGTSMNLRCPTALTRVVVDRMSLRHFTFV
jgi:hypothetical protein